MRPALPLLLSFASATTCSTRAFESPGGAPFANAASGASFVDSSASAHLLQSSFDLLRDLVPQRSALTERRVVLGPDGAVPSFARAGLADVLPTLDELVIGRLDLAALPAGTRITLWLDARRELEALRIDWPSGQRLLAGRANDALPELYDDRGFSLAGPILARPLSAARITSRFGERLHPLEKRVRHHDGVDYGVPSGTAVHAVADGRVKAVGSSGSAGLFVILAHAAGYESHYLHLSKLAELRVGDRVTQSEEIGLSGNTGHSTGPHLHYELLLAGIPVDPQRTLPIPNHALGPLQLKEHRAFLASLEQEERP